MSVKESKKIDKVTEHQRGSPKRIEKWYRMHKSIQERIRTQAKSKRGV